MAKFTVNAALAYVSAIHLWLDSIDAGPHPMDPNAKGGFLKKYLVSGALAELAKVSPEGAGKKKLTDLSKRLAVEGIRGLAGAISDDDEQTDWHPPIPKWGGRTEIDASGNGWLETLPKATLASLLDGAAASLQQRVSVRGG